jgi:hypothetical protein
VRALDCAAHAERNLPEVVGRHVPTTPFFHKLLAGCCF